MPATNFTPIQLYRTNTASTTAPSAGNLNAGELAINYNDGGMILFAKNTTGNVIKLMNNPASLLYPTADGTNGQVIKTDGSGTLSFTTVGYINIPQSGSAKTTAYTLTTGDVGEFIEVGSGGSIEIPDATFSAGDAVLIFNNTTGDITITCTITTAYIAGTDADKATMTLATRGIASILFVSGTVCVVTGNVS